MGYISQDARVEKSQLSESTRVYSRAVVTNSVLEEDVSVGDDTIIVHSEIEPFCEIDRRNYIHHSVIGKFTYTGWNTYIGYSEIGKFCSISRNVDIGGADHNYKNITTMPAEKIEQMRTGIQPIWSGINKVHVGNDVWIGQGATILKRNGICIGNGAIVASGAVVSKDIGPYEIWGGVPAKFIKYRFKEEWIKRLLEIEWWDFPTEIIEKNIGLFQEEMSNSVIDHLEHLKIDYMKEL